MKKKEVQALLAASMVAISLSLSGCTSKEEKHFLKLLNDGDYSDAVDFYSENSEKINDKTLKSSVEKTIEKIQTDYLEKNLSFDDASNSLYSLYSLGDPDLEDLLDNTVSHISQIDDSRNSFESAEAYYENGDYLSAHQMYSNVIEDDEDNYKTAQSRMEECKSSYKTQVLENAAASAEQGDYDSAISILENAHDYYIYNDDEEIAGKLKEYTVAKENAIITEQLDDTMQLIKNGDYYTAITQINEFLQEYPGNEMLEELKKTTETSYLDVILPLIKDYMESEDYSDAFTLCTDALSIIPDSSELASLKEQIEPLKPTLLSEMTISESANFEQMTDRTTVYKDVVGTQFNPGNLYQVHLYHDGWGGDSDGYAKVYLNGQYKTMDTTIALDDTSETGSCIFTIYGDNEILYSKEFNRTTPPDKIELDVTGRQWIEFSIAYPDEETYGYTSNIFLAGTGFSH